MKIVTRSNAGAVGEIITGCRPFRNRAQILGSGYPSIKEKERRRKRTAAFDIITDANEAAERKISAPLLKAFAAVIGREEAAGRDRKIPNQIITAHLVFIADPIEETKISLPASPYWE